MYRGSRLFVVLFRMFFFLRADVVLMLRLRVLGRRGGDPGGRSPGATGAEVCGGSPAETWLVDAHSQPGRVTDGVSLDTTGERAGADGASESTSSRDLVLCVL